MDPSAWTTSFDSVFVMTDDNGQLIDTHVIQLVVTDQCGNSIVHDQEVLYPVIFETEICGGDVQEFPAYSGHCGVRRPAQRPKLDQHHLGQHPFDGRRHGGGRQLVA